MPIKLIQVQRKLNVGINTVVEFLHRNGFSVEDNPNTRISDEQYALLVKEFGKDLPEKDRNFAADRAQKEAPSVKEEKTAEIKTVIPEEFRPKILAFCCNWCTKGFYMVRIQARDVRPMLRSNVSCFLRMAGRNYGMFPFISLLS